MTKILPYGSKKNPNKLLRADPSCNLHEIHRFTAKYTKEFFFSLPNLFYSLLWTLGTNLPLKTDIFVARLDPTTKRLKHLNIEGQDMELDGVASLIADTPPLKLHQ